MKSLATVVFLIICLSSSHGNSFSVGGESRNQATERTVVELVNRARAKGMRCGKTYYKAAPPVVWNDLLWQASLKHCSTMARTGSLCHTDYYGGKPGDSVARLGYKWSAYGENVAEGYRTPEETVNGWLKSPEHCRTIMDPAFKEAGSCNTRGQRNIYWTLILAAPDKRAVVGP
ncbi:MAG TPA: CAP domain-containing protein [Thermodesulfovibrionales bacterium]|nr:CAP domain-containing protein [Thermodesulfovibrionales bacterium]